MCGIVGYIGQEQIGIAAVAEGLRILEYRGYDSAGLAYLDNTEKIIFQKSVGRVQNLEKDLLEDGMLVPAATVIGHTRWATHGAPTVRNAHPHYNTDKTIAVVHNGIIENHQELRLHLEAKGYVFVSDTDTEVIPHLIDFYVHESKSFTSGLEKALSQLRGAYALLVMTSQTPDVLYAARLSSPLVVGLKSNAVFVASDPTAIMEHTKKVLYLNDYELAVVNRAGTHQIRNFKHAKITTRQAEELEYDATKAQLGDFPHFMLKEIYEIPDTIRAATRGRIKLETETVKLGGLESVSEQLQYIDRIVIAACGTASYAGLFGEYAIEELAGIPVEVQQASEFKYRQEPFSRSTALIAVSQSGETADTIAALKKVENYGILRLGVVNATGSTIARMTEAGVYCHAGPEQAVASTKAFFAQSIVLILIGLYLSNGSTLLRRPLLEELLVLPEKAKQVLEQSPAIEKLAKKYKDYEGFFYLGRGYGYPCALEGTLKHKECALVHAEAYPAGEMKHGPLALIDKNFPTIVIATDSPLLEKTMSNIQEIRARKGPVIAIATEGNIAIKQIADDVLFVPKSLKQTSPLLAAIVLQLFSYYTTVIKGHNVDRPRNLAKSVTVE